MDSISTRIPYRQTGAFSSIALDYIDQATTLRSFFAHVPSLQGIRQAIKAREKIHTDRKTLVKILEIQYGAIQTTRLVRQNIRSLLSPNTFTVTTAHQNNLFTGPLYFIYKIIHVVRLAQHLKTSLPGYEFIPLFYMGSEDADLDELNHIHLGSEKLTWETGQRGAVGRMKVDKKLLELISKMEGELSVLPNGSEMVTVLRDCYREGMLIQEATFRFLDFFFSEYGLVVLIPDHADLKKQMSSIFEDDLLHRSATAIVQSTIDDLEKNKYRGQANPREINLFYMVDGMRERIGLMTEKNGAATWKVWNSDIRFTKEELLNELRTHPERFSPNVILRGIFQESILPNIAFIGGSGELAYWLQLRSLFDHYKILFPVLVLRNSYLIIEKKWRGKISGLGLSIEDFFQPEKEILEGHVLKLRGHEMKLNGSLTEVEQLYDMFKKQAAAIDPTLEVHVDALRSQALGRLLELEKKMIRAEKKKFSDQQRQIHSIKEKLFPGNELQERYDNICYYYAKWGKGIFDTLLKNACALEQEFCLLEEK